MKKGSIALLQKPFGPFAIEHHELPRIGKTTLLLRIELCGICGTDVHIYEGKHHDVAFPIILGHEIVGTIEEMGDEVGTDYCGKTIRPGDRITLTPAMVCGSCFFCAVVKTPVRCVNATQFGFFSGNRAEMVFNGGYAQYLDVDATKTGFFKTDIPPEQGVFGEPLAVALHSVIRAGIQPGDSVVVQGAGTLGLLHVLAANVAGAASITLVTSRNTEKLEIGRAFGADRVITMKDTSDRRERIEAVRRQSISGYGADAVFECVGKPAVIDEGLEYVRDSGVYCIVGHAVDEGTVAINPLPVMERNIRIAGIFDHSVEHFYRAQAILETQRFPVQRMLTHKVPMGHMAEAFNRLVSKERYNGNEIIKAAVAPW